MSVFEFKDFSVHQANSPLKVSTDAILLGSTVKIDKSNASLLDVGTGNGVIALLLASRYSNILIDAIDPHLGACQDAKQNFENAVFANRLRLFCTNLATHDPRLKYDIIVSNPPYFIDGLGSDNESTQQAKHISISTFHALLLDMKNRLVPSGTLWLVLAPESAIEAIAYLQNEGLYLRNKLRFHANSSKLDKRWILCFSFEKSVVEQQAFFIRNLDGSYHDDYKKLAGAYHNRAL
ncbi:MAG: tRNA1(Val) (adenine(37)-N6)-methyltransferase [Sphingomonadales bacterium]|jgi:tRNA1Val (adenine37-N6)-methyltransferase